MREIQDMTLNVSRGLERLERRLSERSKRFLNEFNCFKIPEIALGVRATAAPVGDDIHFDRVFHQGTIVKNLGGKLREVHLHRKCDGSRKLDPRADLRPNYWRPMLRTARADSDSFFAERLSNKNISLPSYNGYWEVHWDGLVELGFVSERTLPMTAQYYLPPDLPVILFSNLVAQVLRVRSQAGVPMAEYAIEVEFNTREVSPAVAAPEALHNGPEGRLEPGKVIFPRYLLGDSIDVPSSSTIFY